MKIVLGKLRSILYFLPLAIWGITPAIIMFTLLHPPPALLMCDSILPEVPHWTRLRVSTLIYSPAQNSRGRQDISWLGEP
jgi:hypothetical protein